MTMTAKPRKKTRVKRTIVERVLKTTPKKKQKERGNVGVRMQPHLMMVGFRHPNATVEVIDGVRDLYRRRWFSQRELGEMFNISVSLVAKIVRTDPFWRN